jgi:hypothetical protein
MQPVLFQSSAASSMDALLKAKVMWITAGRIQGAENEWFEG